MGMNKTETKYNGHYLFNGWKVTVSHPISWEFHGQDHCLMGMNLLLMA